MKGRWLCNACGLRFETPDFSIVEVRIEPEEITSAEDPTLPPGQVIKYNCPSCGSGNLAGSANSTNPFTPIVVRRK